MENKTSFGANRTGISMSPIDSKSLKQFVEQHPPDVEGDLNTLSQARMSYVKDADKIGSVPMPSSLKELLITAKEKLTGTHIETFVDKLGERLAFERSSVRVYDALLVKARNASHKTNSDLLGTLEHFRNEEAEHFAILIAAVESLGGDPTAETPCASVVAVASSGIIKVMADPRTTLAQCLNALLTAELVDNASWELLIKLAKQTKQNQKMIDNFQHALTQEEQHLEKIKTCIEEVTLAELS